MAVASKIMQGSYAEAYTLRGALAKRCGTRRRVQGLLHGLRLDSIAEGAVFSLHQGVRLVYREREIIYIIACPILLVAANNALLANLP